MFIGFKESGILYDHLKLLGGNPSSFIFDKRYLIAFSELPEIVVRETKLAITAEELNRFEELKLIPIIRTEEVEKGVPFYVPTRIGVLKEISKKGFSEYELTGYAEYEEWFIDNMLLAEDDFKYLDDDLDTLIRFLQGRLVGTGISSPQTLETEKEQKFLNQLQKKKASGSGVSDSDALKRTAFQVRMLEESIRLTLVNEIRDRVRTGHSPFIFFSKTSFTPEGAVFEDINWDNTLTSPWIKHDEERSRIRLPEFIISGEKISMQKPIRPDEYNNLWNKYNFDEYFRVYKTIFSEEKCNFCSKALPKLRNPRQLYCNERCRNASKQKRFRAKNPDAAFEAQHRYHHSLDLEENGEY